MIGPLIYTLSIGSLIITIFYLFKTMDEMLHDIKTNRIFIYDTIYTYKYELDNISEVESEILSSSESDSIFEQESELLQNHKSDIISDSNSDSSPKTDNNSDSSPKTDNNSDSSPKTNNNSDSSPKTELLSSKNDIDDVSEKGFMLINNYDKIINSKSLFYNNYLLTYFKYLFIRA